MMRNNKIGLYLTTIFFTCLCVGIGISAISNYTEYENERPTSSPESRVNRDKRKFDFLMESGEIKMKDKRYEEALVEFELALDIIPNDSIANERILECSRFVFTKN